MFCCIHHLTIASISLTFMFTGAIDCPSKLKRPCRMWLNKHMGSSLSVMSQQKQKHNEQQTVNICGLRHQKQIFKVCRSNYIPQLTVGCNHFSLPLLSASLAPKSQYAGGRTVSHTTRLPTCISNDQDTMGGTLGPVWILRPHLDVWIHSI